MCGIIGYVGKRNTSKLLIDGLKKLEYRGYDSAGICILNNNNLTTIKRKGKIKDLEVVEGISKIKGNIGIAHTRWATHGEPSQINAHPHTDSKGEIALVHNGIIENYHSLKELLIQDGYIFTSETDSEILVHLIKKFYMDDLETAVKNALSYVEGTFGIAVLHKNENRIVVARRGSPLIIGIGENEMIFASDAIPIMDYTKRVIYLNDDEMAILSANDFKICKIDGEIVDSEIHEIKWSIDQIEKKGYKHFMLKEIFEQPEAMENVLRGRIKEGKIKLTIDFDVSKLERIVITACGTSWHSALLGKFFIEKHVNIPVEIDYASEYRYRQTIVKDNDLFVVISQSGETADTLAALRKAKADGAKSIGLINVVGSTIAREVDSGIYLHAGPEIGVASTKAFLCQVTALILLGLYIKQEKGEKLDQEILKELFNVPEKIKKCLNLSKEISEIAKNYTHSRNFLYLGRNNNFPVALEGALKLKEISYIHAEGYPAAEMKHGPIALIDEEMPVVFIATNSAILDKVISNMEETRARKGVLITITDNGNEAINRLSDKIISVPRTHEDLSPLINVIPLQLLAYHIADLKDLNVDRPRNLAKSVTVE